MRKQIKLLKRYYAKEFNIPETDIVAFNIVKVKSSTEIVFYIEEANGRGRVLTHTKRDLSFISKLPSVSISKQELIDSAGRYKSLIANKLNLLYGMEVCESDIEYAFVKDNILSACVSGNSMRFQGDFQIKII